MRISNPLLSKSSPRAALSHSTYKKALSFDRAFLFAPFYREACLDYTWPVQLWVRFFKSRTPFSAYRPNNPDNASSKAGRPGSPSRKKSAKTCRQTRKSPGKSGGKPPSVPERPDLPHPGRSKPGAPSHPEPGSALLSVLSKKPKASCFRQKTSYSAKPLSTR